MNWDDWLSEWERRIVEHERRVKTLQDRAEVDLLELQFQLPAIEPQRGTSA